GGVDSILQTWKLRTKSQHNGKGARMSARIAQERIMTDHSRMGKLESDVQQLQRDVTEMKGMINWLREAFDGLKSELLSYKTEVARELGIVGTSIESLRTSIERAKLWMMVTGVGTVLSVWGAAFALARLLKP